jgi:hypothetical protein
MYAPEDDSATERLDVGVEISECVVGDVRGGGGGPLIPTGDMLYPLCD